GSAAAIAIRRTRLPEDRRGPGDAVRGGGNASGQRPARSTYGSRAAAGAATAASGLSRAVAAHERAAHPAPAHSGRIAGRAGACLGPGDAAVRRADGAGDRRDRARRARFQVDGRVALAEMSGVRLDELSDRVVLREVRGRTRRLLGGEADKRARGRVDVDERASL